MAGQGYELVRYAADFVILCRSRAQAEEALAAVREWVNEAGLQLHPAKTCVTDARQKGGGFDFLGYHFERGQRVCAARRFCATAAEKPAGQAARTNGAWDRGGPPGMAQ